MEIRGLILHEPVEGSGTSELMCHINTTFSCAHLIDGGIRLRAKREDFNGNTQARDKAIGETVDMLVGFPETHQIMSSNFGSVIEQLKKMIDIQEGTGKFYKKE